MIQGFEQQTAPLSEYEQKTLLPVLVRGLQVKVGADRVVAGSAIVRGMKQYGFKIDGPRLRKIINHIRTNDLIPGLVSNGQGYYIATSADEIEDCIESIQGRIASQQEIVKALQRQKRNFSNTESQ